MLARSWGLCPGRLQPGPLNSIADVGGVCVGHVTYCEGDIQTGVTALLPHRGNIFRQKVPAACHVINGFGKSAGLIQLNELGNIETPIILTSTLNVGTAFQGLVEHALRENPEIGRSTGTVNPLVLECNDGFLNDIRRPVLKKADIFQAVEAAAASGTLQEGAVGAGRGMSCYELKGGIGSASRTFIVDGKTINLGALVLTNYGRLPDLRIGGDPVGSRLAILSSETKRRPEQREQGSVIVLLATDAPLDSRQLLRLARRGEAGLARCGSFIAGGSGEIVVAFSTAYTIPHIPERAYIDCRCLHDDYLDTPFLAAVEAIEEAVLNSMIASETVTGRVGNTRHSLSEYLAGLGYSHSE
ncbi:DmpA family aminopeptidase [Sediminispirochaeta bajacaliforniensis]|uniref:DmpA family aminopeptidase n=1 Tax=Sediminispirochaeta bajacaliforniensis TaxID=148 RepID=UPI00037C757B|nr:P1 family peptidase [Sediminispirochaeta bajacaliforniensis]